MMWDFILRLFVAGILGAVVGLDREYRAKEAGYRTHFLVSLGSALIMVVSQYGFQDVILENSVSLDPSRVAAQVDSPMAAEAEIAIEPVVGPEFVTGSTRMKSGTAQKMVLNMITTSTMIKLGRVKGNRMVNMQLTNQKLVDRGTRMIMEELRLDYEQSKNLLLLHGSVREAIDSYHREWRLNQ